MILTALFIVFFIVAASVYLNRPQFGKLSEGERLQRIKNSPNYKDGKFQNLSFTPDLAEGVTYYKVMKEFIFEKSKRIKPSTEVPSVKTDLRNLSPGKNVFIWFGHGSYFMQLDGKKTLVDPVLSGHASPEKFITKSYKGSDIYTADDIPVIDYLFVSHDHWDHLDYKAMIKLQPRIKSVITGLGVGSHFERWGYDQSKIQEKDWYEEFDLDSGFNVITVPARHFSGRGLKRNQSLWMSYILKTPSFKIFIGGDSGYDTHFSEIGKKHGPFDFAILECGQYNPNWKYIHMMPEEVVQAAIDLNAKNFIPVHWGKFTLAQHAWDDPIIFVTAEANKRNVSVTHPIIGEEVDLNQDKKFSSWWEIVN